LLAFAFAFNRSSLDPLDAAVLAGVPQVPATRKPQTATVPTAMVVPANKLDPSIRNHQKCEQACNCTLTSG
jgi:hypothetical protein